RPVGVEVTALGQPARGGRARHRGRRIRRHDLAAHRPGRPGLSSTRAKNAAAVRAVVGGMLRIARRDFDRALVGDVVVDGPRRELWAARGTGWASDAALAALNRLLVQIPRLLRGPRGGARRRMISLCYVLAPMTPRPRRRSEAPLRPRQRRAR